MQSKASMIEDRLNNAGNLDGKQILESVISITQEVSVNMVHKEEYLDLKAETGNLVA